MTDNEEIEWHIQGYYLAIKRNVLASTFAREFSSGKRAIRGFESQICAWHSRQPD
jgi:hypothetical protein